MGVKIKDYIIEIKRQQTAALETGSSSIVIRAKELHAKCRSKDAPSLIQCCSAMKQSMLQGDEILLDKACKTGASTSLTIRYYLHDLDTRTPLYVPKKKGRPAKAKDPEAEISEKSSEEQVAGAPKRRGRPAGSKNKKTLEKLANSEAEQQDTIPAAPKKRGRPAGSKNKKTLETLVTNVQDAEPAPLLIPKKRGRPAGSKNRKTLLEEETIELTPKDKSLNALFEDWMRTERLKYESFEHTYIIDDAYGLWMITKYQDGSDSERFLSSLKMINEDIHKCSILYKDTKSARDFWNEMPEEVIDRLNLSAFFITEDGSVSQSI